MLSNFVSLAVIEIVANIFNARAFGVTIYILVMLLQSTRVVRTTIRYRNDTESNALLALHNFVFSNTAQ